ncbi:aminoglycoside phosphotransferase family protein [Saccharothrix longispora]|uniref:aminoglycoside phosphotransferase family protein n=1 Tax=Saccharothrix longispora TaxID=33920 RepID=UPI0028FD1CA2|nr:aminoglycoside phosphotransferase family protein [Saccharothrix longispora]MDU0290114.1 aminoglycoside phosphotransferase family protein [Saccharothrix longispora]
MTGPAGSALRWVERRAARVVGARGLREGGSPWLLDLDGRPPAVLRIGRDDPDVRARFVTEVAALRLAERHALPTPRVLAADVDGAEAGSPALLTTALPGRSAMPPDPPAARLRALGAAAAALHEVVADPLPGLPLRRWPMDGPGGGFARVRDAVGSALVAEAVAREDRLPAPVGPTVLVHADLWLGNVLWVGDEVSGVVDWECAGVGAPGVDLGNLRCDAAMLLGGDAPDLVLDGWCAAAGGPARDVARWDVAAALSGPADVAAWLPAIHDQGRTDLTADVLARRRDAFLRAALDRWAG